jgi:hypothetical protein
MISNINYLWSNNHLTDCLSYFFEQILKTMQNCVLLKSIFRKWTNSLKKIFRNYFHWLCNTTKWRIFLECPCHIKWQKKESVLLKNTKKWHCLCLSILLIKMNYIDFYVLFNLSMQLIDFVKFFDELLINHNTYIHHNTPAGD